MGEKQGEGQLSEVVALPRKSVTNFKFVPIPFKGSLKVTAASLVFAASLLIVCSGEVAEMVTLTVDDRLLAAYVFYGSILMLKTSLMSFLTARHRIKNKVSVERYKKLPHIHRGPFSELAKSPRPPGVSSE